MKEADKIAIKEKLAQAYCYPETENKEMDCILMFKIAEIIEPVIDDIVKKEKEKAESELKAIKDRIEALEPSIISKIMTEYLNWRDLSFATVESEHKCCEEILEILIKQIGGVK